MGSGLYNRNTQITMFGTWFDWIRHSYIINTFKWCWTEALYLRWQSHWNPQLAPGRIWQPHVCDWTPPPAAESPPFQNLQGSQGKVKGHLTKSWLGCNALLALSDLIQYHIQQTVNIPTALGNIPRKSQFCFQLKSEIIFHKCFQNVNIRRRKYYNCYKKVWSHIVSVLVLCPT